MNFNLKKSKAFYTSFVESLKYEKFASFLESIKPAVTAIDLAAFEALQSDVKALVEAKVDYETYSSYRKFRWPEADAKKSNGDYDLNFNQILNILDTKVAEANNNASKIQQAIMGYVGTYAYYIANNVQKASVGYGQPTSAATDVFQEAMVDLYNQAKKHVADGSKIDIIKYKYSSHYMLETFGKHMVASPENTISFDDNGTAVRVVSWKKMLANAARKPETLESLNKKFTKVVAVGSRKFRRTSKLIPEELLTTSPIEEEMAPYWKEINITTTQTNTERPDDEGSNQDDLIAKTIGTSDKDSLSGFIGSTGKRSEDINYDNKAETVLSSMYADEIEMLNEEKKNTTNPARLKAIDKRLERIDAIKGLAIDKMKLRNQKADIVNSNETLLWALNNKSMKEIKDMMDASKEELDKLNENPTEDNKERRQSLEEYIKLANEYFNRPANNLGNESAIEQKYNVSKPTALTYADEMLPELAHKARINERLVKAAAEGTPLSKARLDPRIEERKNAYNELANDLNIPMEKIKDFSRTNNRFDILKDKRGFVRELLADDPKTATIYNIANQFGVPYNQIKERVDKNNIDVTNPNALRSFISSIVDDSDVEDMSGDDLILKNLADKMKLDITKVKTAAKKLKVDPTDRDQLRGLIKNLVDTY